MIRLFIISLCLSSSLQLAAQTDNSLATTHEPSGYVPEGYELNWSDEFASGTTLNSNDWTHEMKSKGWVNNELQYYVNHTTPEGNLVTEIKDDALIIRCLKENGRIYSGRVYAKVRQGWTYGYIEGRIKLPKGKGTWPAFWMMPVNFRSWPADGEIDIMEEVGYHPNYVSSSLHANAHVHSNGTQVTHEMLCEGAEDGYHVYGIEWTAQKITTYVDGKKQLEYANRGLGRDDWPYDDPFYVILNLAWGGDWGGAQGVDETALPVEMLIDYVRVYQKSDPDSEPKDNLKLGDTKMESIGGNAYSAITNLEQGKNYKVTGDLGLTGKSSWYYDPDFFTRNTDGSLKFIAVSGRYQVTAYFGADYFRVTPLTESGEWVTYNKDDGTGCLWVIGNNGIGKPSSVYAGNWGAINNWSPTPEMFFPVPQISEKVYQMTLTVGQQLNATDVNFKFFHQAGYGNDNNDEFNVKQGSPCHISMTSDVFKVDDVESGNIKLRSGAKITDGETYVFTIDCSDPKNAIVTVAGGSTSGIRPVAMSDRDMDGEIYNLQGHRMPRPGKGLYIQNGHKYYTIPK